MAREECDGRTASRASSASASREATLEPVTAPNDTWCIDFKGEFRIGTGQLCYPLTVTDSFSRFLFDARAMPGTRLI